jgi:TetR/AcrR family transcriptional repressor of mexJK operon
MHSPALAPSTAIHDLSPKRHAIVEAAAMLFMAHGYGSVSMDAIAREAGVSKATLYAHFASKDRLFATIVGGKCARVALDESTFPDTDTGDVRVALTAIGLRLLRFLLAPETQAILRIVIAESVRFPELGAAFIEAGPVQFIAHLRDWLMGQDRAGRLSVPDATVAADQFGALLRPMLFLRTLAGVPPTPSEDEITVTVADAVTTFLRAYAA